MRKLLYDESWLTRKVDWWGKYSYYWDRQTDRLVNRQLLSCYSNWKVQKMSHFYLLQYASADSQSDTQDKLSDRHNARYYVAIATEKYGICLISIYFSMLLQTVNLMLWLNYQTQSNKVITVTLPTSNTSFAFHFTIISILQYIVV